MSTCSRVDAKLLVLKTTDRVFELVLIRSLRPRAQIDLDVLAPLLGKSRTCRVWGSVRWLLGLALLEFAGSVTQLAVMAQRRGNTCVIATTNYKAFVPKQFRTMESPELGGG